VEAFLQDWLPAAVRSLDDAPPPPAHIAEVVRAWAAWAARQGGTPLLTRDALARAVDELLSAYLAEAPVPA
jgi:hypothetical protein